jgi:hypothetical protein
MMHGGLGNLWLILPFALSLSKGERETPEITGWLSVRGSTGLS